MNSDFEDEAREFAWMTRLSKETGRPVWFLLTDRPTDPERWRRLMRGVHKARAEGARITAQVAGRPVGVILGHNTSMNPFTFRPAYRALDSLPAAERWARLRDPAVRARDPGRAALRARAGRQGQFIRFVATRWDRMFVMGEPARLRAGAGEERRRDRRARQPHPGRDRLRLPDRGGGQFPVLPGGRLCPWRPRADPRDCCSIPAHCWGSATAARIAARSSMPALPTTCWPLGARPQARPGPAARTSGQDADQRDRRFLRLPRPRPAQARPARRPQPDRFRPAAPAPARDRHDLPAGGRRLVQRVDGYRATLVAGTPVFEHGEDTGARPGRLVRKRALAARLSFFRRAVLSCIPRWKTAATRAGRSVQ